jgi:hypothetical protein
VASSSRVAPIHLGLDVHKDTISVGISYTTDNQLIINANPAVKGRELLGRISADVIERVC